MKGKQVRVVLAALLIVGLAGLVFRIVSSSENEVVLSGLSPLEREFIDRVVIRSPESEAVVEGKVIGNQKIWFVNVTDPVFVPKIDQFWSAMAEIDEAGLIALNVDNHERMGVDEASGTLVEFYLGGAVQEQLIIGSWDQDVRLCYVRRSGQDAVYGIECPVPAASIFDPTADDWRNPIIASIPAQEVESIVFSYPDQQFAVSLVETEAGYAWMASRPIEESPGVEEVEANPYIVQNLLNTFQGLLATGFADDDEADELIFDAATPSIRIQTVEGSTSPTIRLRFLPRDEETSYVKTGSQPTVFVIPRGLAELLLIRQEVFGLGLEEESDESEEESDG